MCCTLTVIFLIIICLCGSTNDSSSSSSYNDNYYSEPRKLSKKEIKKIRKAQERAEMDAFEDMIMYMEAWYDD